MVIMIMKTIRTRIIMRTKMKMIIKIINDDVNDNYNHNSISCKVTVKQSYYMNNFRSMSPV